MALTLANVAHVDGLDRTPGTEFPLLYNVRDNLTTIPDLPAAPASDAERVTIDDDFVIVVGKPFKTLEVTPESGRIKGKRIGDKTGGLFEYTYEFFVPKSAAAEAMFRQMHNSYGYFQITELDGSIRLMGCLQFPAFLTGIEHDGGKAGEEQGPGYMCTITCKGKTPAAPLFTGAAPTA